MEQLSISKEDINKLPLFEWDGKTQLIDTEKEAREAVAYLEKQPVLGFDTETRAAFKKGESYNIALLQLATAERAYLFRINKIPLFQELVNIFENDSIVKAGVAVRDDIKGLQKLFPFTDRNFVELADVAKERKIKNFGLRGLVALKLGKRLSKREKVSNWEKDPLTPGQVTYAACDAYAGFLLYQEFFK